MRDLQPENSVEEFNPLKKHWDDGIVKFPIIQGQIGSFGCSEAQSREMQQQAATRVATRRASTSLRPLLCSSNELVFSNCNVSAETHARTIEPLLHETLHSSSSDQ